MSEDRTKTAHEARRLIRKNRTATLATCSFRNDGHPYASFVTYACDMDTSPVFLFSALSDHVKNLSNDKRASLLIEAASRCRNPQTGPRVSLSGTIGKISDTLLSERYLRLHPEARQYAGFGDFGFYRMDVEDVHWVGGFARARWLKASDVLYPARKICRAVQQIEEDVIGHMNNDHMDALDVCARTFARRRGNGWQMAGLDPEGFHLHRKGRFARLEFPSPVSDAASCRSALIAMAKQARARQKPA